MRLALLLTLLLVLSMPVVPASAPVMPGMLVQLQPAVQNIDAKNQSVSVFFNGTVNVSANPLTDMSVALTSAVDTGWGSAVIPSTMAFSGSGSQRFTANVTVPPNGNGTANLTVTVKGNTRFLLLTAEVIGVINVAGPANQSPNQTVPLSSGTGGGGTARFAGMDPLVLGAMVVVVTSIACVGGYLLLRRRKARRLAAASLPA